MLLSSRGNSCFDARNSMNMLRLALFTMKTCVNRPTEGLNYTFWNKNIALPPSPPLKNCFAAPHELSYLCLKISSIICPKIFIKLHLDGFFREIKRILLYIYNYAYSYSFYCKRYSLLHKDLLRHCMTPDKIHMIV